MIRGLRRTQLPLVTAIAAITLGVGALALRAPSSESVPSLPADPELANPLALRVRSRAELRPQVLFDEESRIEVVQDPLRVAPGMLLLCGVRDFEPAWTDTGRVLPLAEITELSPVGALTARRREVFELPTECRTPETEIFFYSTGHEEVVARAALTPPTIEGGS